MAFLLGAGTVLLAKPSLYLPQILFVIAASAELFQWRSDVLKSRSEALLRKLDLCRSFDMEISEADRRDIVFDLPGKLRRTFSESNVPDTYFTGSEAPGARKAVENLIESAWYTRQQAKMMVTVCVVLICAVVVIALVSLVVAMNEVAPLTTRATISKVVTAWLLLIF